MLEGLDGAGTTTQAQRAVARLLRQGVRAHLTREPSDGPAGRLLREFLTGRHAIEGQALRPEMLALLFAADRVDHGQREVDPQIDAGAVVVSDRWYHSSLAYQATEIRGPGGLAWVMQCNQYARVPDLTIFLQVDPEICAHRRVRAGRAQELFDDLQMQRSFDWGYRQAFTRVEARGERVEILDGEASVDDVEAQVQALIDDLR